MERANANNTMMKKQLFLLLLAILLPLAAMAQQQLTVGDVTMTISPEKGAKILSLQYKGQEVISQLTAPESFGSTFWTSPQKEWNWPPVRELECQGAYATLKPHEQLSWSVRWYLLPFKGNAEPSSKLMKTTKKYLR